ncbi:hypothetical protein KXD40_009542 [Peronospora effusa]|nr:hypothetical protein KXD40_009542 [Peronospora effusa]
MRQRALALLDQAATMERQRRSQAQKVTLAKQLEWHAMARNLKPSELWVLMEEARHDADNKRRMMIAAAVFNQEYTRYGVPG